MKRFQIASFICTIYDVIVCMAGNRCKWFILSSYFNLAGEIMLPLVGGIVGLFIMSINKQQTK